MQKGAIAFFTWVLGRVARRHVGDSPTRRPDMSARRHVAGVGGCRRGRRHLSSRRSRARPPSTPPGSSPKQTFVKPVGRPDAREGVGRRVGGLGGGGWGEGRDGIWQPSPCAWPSPTPKFTAKIHRCRHNGPTCWRKRRHCLPADMCADMPFSPTCRRADTARPTLVLGGCLCGDGWGRVESGWGYSGLLRVIPPGPAAPPPIRAPPGRLGARGPTGFRQLHFVDRRALHGEAPGLAVLG